MHCGGGRAFNRILNIFSDEEKVASKPSQNRDFLACPKCGYEIKGKFNWCPRCGSRVVPFQCEYCQGIIPRDVGTCPRCGAPAG